MSLEQIEIDKLADEWVNVVSKQPGGKGLGYFAANSGVSYDPKDVAAFTEALRQRGDPTVCNGKPDIVARLIEVRKITGRLILAGLVHSGSGGGASPEDIMTTSDREDGG